MERRCPRTGSSLKPLKLGSVTLDFSETCGGVFFDRLEMQRFEENSAAGEHLAELMASHHDLGLDYSEPIRCPDHLDVVMQRRFYSPKRGMQLDECPSCGGIWLDGDDLETARYEYPDAESRRHATEAFLANVMRSPPIIQHDQELLADLSKLSRIREALTWLVRMAYRS